MFGGAQNVTSVGGITSMAELTYLTEGEKIEVLEETISKIGRLQAEISVAKKKLSS